MASAPSALCVTRPNLALRVGWDEVARTMPRHARTVPASLNRAASPACTLRACTRVRACALLRALCCRWPRLPFHLWRCVPP